MPTSNDARRRRGCSGGVLIRRQDKYPGKRGRCLRNVTTPDVQARVAALGPNIPSNKDKPVDAFLTPSAAIIRRSSRRQLRQRRNGVVHRQLGRYRCGVSNRDRDKIFAGQATPGRARRQPCDTANVPMFKSSRSARTFLQVGGECAADCAAPGGPSPLPLHSPEGAAHDRQQRTTTPSARDCFDAVLPPGACPSGRREGHRRANLFLLRISLAS